MCQCIADWSSKTILTLPSSSWGATYLENSLQKSPAVSGMLSTVLHAMQDQSIQKEDNASILEDLCVMYGNSCIMPCMGTDSAVVIAKGHAKCGCLIAKATE